METLLFCYGTKVSLKLTYCISQQYSMPDIYEEEALYPISRGYGVSMARFLETQPLSIANDETEYFYRLFAVL